MKKKTSPEVAFDVFCGFMVRMIQKYGDSIQFPDNNQVKCASKKINVDTPADNTESSAVVCNRENISTDEVKD